MIFFNSNSYSQEIKEIKINFLDKPINVCELSGLKLKEGDLYRLVIDSINLNLFRVKVNYSDTIYSKPLETPTFDGFGLDAITKAISGLSDLSDSVTKTENDFNKSFETLHILLQSLPDSVQDEKEAYIKLKFRINQENGKLKELNEYCRVLNSM